MWSTPRLGIQIPPISLLDFSSAWPAHAETTGVRCAACARPCCCTGSACGLRGATRIQRHALAHRLRHRALETPTSRVCAWSESDRVPSWSQWLVSVTSQQANFDEFLLRHGPFWPNQRGAIQPFPAKPFSRPFRHHTAISARFTLDPTRCRSPRSAWLRVTRPLLLLPSRALAELTSHCNYDGRQCHSTHWHCPHAGRALPSCDLGSVVMSSRMYV